VKHESKLPAAKDARRVKVTSATRKAAPPARGDFRQRYDAMEDRREELIERLRALGGKAPAHPGYKRALNLLNDKFRKAKLAQRAAVLESAEWLIDILERLAPRSQD
jgi:hypothetical protein